MVARFEIYLLNLDDEIGKNAKNTRPCVVISPDEMNRHLSHALVAPISSTRGDYPTRLPLDLLNSERTIVLDQLRTVDTARLVKKIGEVGKNDRKKLIECLLEMFAQ